MAERTSKLSNTLALAVLAFVAEQPRHPYEIARLLRQRGKDHSIRINYGSLYTVVRNLEKHGFVEAVGTEREGRRPERTVYGVTETGRAELRTWLSQLLRTPEKEYPQFEAALSLLPVLPPEEVEGLLAERQQTLDAQVSAIAADLSRHGEVLPRLFLVETEYQLALLRAEAGWLRAFRAELASGEFEGLAGWRRFHATGQVPPEFTELEQRIAEGTP